MAKKRTCGVCGNEATGYASVYVGGVETWFCHGDDDAEPTCYERGQGASIGSLFPQWVRDAIQPDIDKMEGGRPLTVQILDERKVPEFGPITYEIR